MKKQIRVLHLSTSVNGGAARAAQQISNALNFVGVKSEFISLTNNNSSESNRILKSRKICFFKRAIRYLFHFRGLNLFRKAKSELGYEFISLPFSDVEFDYTYIINNYDVVNLHWVSGFVNYPSFFQRVSIPIIWTIHDMNPFMGVIHYSADLSLNSSDSLVRAESYFSNLKFNCVRSNKNLTIVYPSSWMMSKAREFACFQGLRQRCIPYTVDFSIFKNYDDKVFIRKIYGIDRSTTVFLFIAEDFNSHRKGFDVLLRALGHLEEFEFSVLVVGAGIEQQNSLLNRVRYLGRINDKITTALIYNLSDCLILPSRQDNLPNTLLESLACGTPVICSDGGGMIDLVVENKNGFIFNSSDSSDLAIKMKKFLFNGIELDRQAIAEAIFISHRQEEIAKLYIKLYEEVNP